MDNYLEKNLAKLKEIKAKNPSATHVYLRRWNKDKLIVDIPMSHADFTIKNNPLWELVSSNKQMDDDIEALFSEPEDKVTVEDMAKVRDGETLNIPPKPSEEKSMQTALIPDDKSTHFEEKTTQPTKKKKAGRPKGKKSKK